MKFSLTAIAKSLFELVAAPSTGEERAKALPMGRPKQARTLQEFWDIHYKPYLDHLRRKGTRRQHGYRGSKWILPQLGHLTWAEIPDAA